MADFKWNEEKNTYELARVGLVEIAKNNIDKYDMRNVVITDDDTFKAVKEARKEINKMVGDLSKARKQMKAIVLSQFEPTCIEIEKYGAMISNELTAKINDYKRNGEEEVKEKTYVLTIKTKEMKVCKKVEEYALKLDCQVITKEG